VWQTAFDLADHSFAEVRRVDTRSEVPESSLVATWIGATKPRWPPALKRRAMWHRSHLM